MNKIIIDLAGGSAQTEKIAPIAKSGITNNSVTIITELLIGSYMYHASLYFWASSSVGLGTWKPLTPPFTFVYNPKQQDQLRFRSNIF